ncbi:MAG: hypothetical protein V4633_22780 [Pseudomonadota bacterium]
MRRTSMLWKFLTLGLLAHASLAIAQQTASPAPSQAPPKLEVIEEGNDAPITVTPPKSGGTKITEKKEGGRVTEIKVKSGKSNYTMKPNIPAGNAQPGDGQSSNVRAPQWTVMEFDLGKKKKTSKDDVPEPTPAKVAPPPAAK